MSELFRRLLDFHDMQPDRRGEAHVECPWCGKEPQRGQTHFSFSRHGAHCFVCGKSSSLEYYARVVGLDGEPVRHYDHEREPVVPRKARRYWWQDHPSDTLAAITRLSVEERWRAWQAYKPVTRAMVERHRLGVGKLPLMWSHREQRYRPASKCTHDRLLVPLFEDGFLVGVRGRAIDCDCGKWLSPGGNHATLYNAEALMPGCTVIIVENAVDALLVTDATADDVVAVSTLSVSYLLPGRDGWSRPGWIAAIKAASPKAVIVWYDNHRPGNGGGPAGKRAWLAKYGRDITPNGKRLCAGLKDEGLPATLYDWAGYPLDTDIWEVMSGKVRKN